MSLFLALGLFLITLCIAGVCLVVGIASVINLVRKPTLEYAIHVLLALVLFVVNAVYLYIIMDYIGGII